MAEEKNPLDRALDMLFFAPVGLLLTARQELPSLAEMGRQRVGGQVALAKMVGRFAVIQGQKEAEKATSRLVKQVTDVVSQFAGPAPAPDNIDLSGPASGWPQAESATQAPDPTGRTVAVPVTADGVGGVAPVGGTVRAASPGGGIKPTTPGQSANVAEGNVQAVVAGSGPQSSNGHDGGRVNSSQTAGAVGATASAGQARLAPDAGSLAIPGYDTLSASQVVQRLAGLEATELDAVGRYESATRGRRTILSKVAQLQIGN